jgi:hypothetical protein
MSELIRPLVTRLADARMTLASLPVAPEPLSFDFDQDPGEPPDVPVPVREAVIRAALDDGLAYHCTESCDHLTDPRTSPMAVFAMGRILCARCVYVRGQDDDGALQVTEPWEGPGESPCTLCGREGPLIVSMTSTSAVEAAMIYVAHVCEVCSGWWPAPRPALEPEPAKRADVTSFQGRRL